MEEKLEQKSGDLVKVVLIGPESTGKTTLARQLASFYHTEWVPEYMREYLQDKWDRGQGTCAPEDMLPIAIGQMKLENEKAKEADRLLFCDTNLMELKVYSEVYYGRCDPLIAKFALQNSYDLYFLTYIDVPWEKDDLRDKPGERTEMFEYFRQALEKYRLPYVVLEGKEKERLRQAKAHIAKIFEK
ncbi:AAA family ATPase [Sinomicrobium soli]|uniref:AAA family ATPase n=1 Tax=Sinomicrobium sp. N-1-3-6 TaxID=2219864 RepID=UPI000DCCE02B|nr:ATP-binding protein [Sinomicrobium sp. N-1-3-6]RAV28529.1 nicotinate-nucleotide adenylyltransferase [Sinomicrobium sp. N-1-3-6]